jgi:hypothetical protein
MAKRKTAKAAKTGSRRNSPRNAAAAEKPVKAAKKSKTTASQEGKVVEVKRIPVGPLSKTGKLLYARLASVIKEHHPKLYPLRVGLFFKRIKESPNAPAKKSECKLVPEEDRDALKFDAKIFLSQVHFDRDTEKVNQWQLDYELDFCLAGIQPALDAKTGEQKIDELDRMIWKIVPPEVSIRPEVFARRGPHNQSTARIRNIAVERMLIDRPLLALLGVDPVESDPDEEGPPVLSMAEMFEGGQAPVLSEAGA